MKDYFIGLDIGTDSVGWAVTDINYNLLKFKGKTLWGVRLFDGAKSAEERRAHRTSRRRIERQHQRITWLQETFSEVIGRVDVAFFQRLKESKFLEEDKKTLSKHIIFADKQYNDVDYYKEYPTIYHLRKALIEDNKTFDIRDLYLAIHHIFKHRGHFLYGDISIDSISLENGLQRLKRAVEQELECSFSVTNIEELKNLLIDRKIKKTEKKKQLQQLFNVTDKKSPLIPVLDLLAGSKVNLDTLYGFSTEEKLSLEDDFSMVEDKLVAVLGDKIELILAIKEIYDWALLENIRSGEEYISFAKVKTYEKHNTDLKKLKMAIKQTEDTALYNEIFHKISDKLNNYPAYSGKDSLNHKCGYDDFCKYLKNKIKPYIDKSELLKEIYDELELGTFLPKQVSKNNSVIPYQLNEAELLKILSNASKHFPFLNEIDNSGLTKAEQIHKMFCFRIPYYVGPLDSRSQYSWIERKNEKIYPWNFEQVVDLEKCRENFISRMTATCSYLGEPVLPKDSLLYSKFMVLNELNNLKINGNEILVSLKQNIYNDLFLSGKKVTKKMLNNYLLANGIIEKGDELSGFDNDFKANLATWKHFEWLLKRDNGYEIAEDIICHIVLFGDDKKLLRQWLENTYSLSDEEQKKALSVRFSGWGRLSQKFLTGIFNADSSTGEAMCIMDLLWNTNQNLMQLLSTKYSFAQAVEQYRKEKYGSNGLTLSEYLDESYASPLIKRAIHQVIRIVGELQSIMKTAPKRIFIEMAREDGEKGKRTISRKQELINLYEQAGEKGNSLFEDLQKEDNLRRDKLYLYYTQLGKCMYSGEYINLAKLDSDYDIEHIYPQSKTKDDSLNNRILVKRVLNAEKSDTYPIDIDIRQKMRPYWTMLKEKRFISKEKYERLVRAKPFTIDEQAGFINRQLVETRQSSKIVAELLARKFKDKTEIVYVKAGNVSNFRQDQRITSDGIQKQASQCKSKNTEQDPVFIKCRDINDFHHAKDAYLNIVVGNVYHVKFTKNPVHFLKQPDVKYSLNRMFDFDVMRGNEQAWFASENGSISIVRKTMKKNNILFTRRASEVKGGLFDQLIVPKSKDKAPIKSSDSRMLPEKYGGYNKLTGAYFCLVEHTQKKKRVRSIETVMLMHKNWYESNPVSYCIQYLGLIEPKILIPKIKINSLISYDGFRMHISGRSDDRILYKNANQLVIAPEWHAYIKRCSKYLERCRIAGYELELTPFDKLSKEENQTLYNILLEKLENTIYKTQYNNETKTLRENIELFYNLSCYEQVEVCLQILNLFKCNASTANFSLINGSSKVGTIRNTKNLNGKKQVSIINQSITGVFEKSIDLLEVGKI